MPYSVIIIIIFGHTVFYIELTLEQQAVLGLLTPHAAENPGIIYSWSSVSVILFPYIQPARTTSIVLHYVFIEKNPHTSRGVEFKPILFKGQLHIININLFIYHITQEAGTILIITLKIRYREVILPERFIFSKSRT